MKAYHIISLFFISTLACAMEQQIPRETRQWNPELYAAGNKVQEDAAIIILSESDISIKGKTILDAGCGIGNISALMAQKAQFVHGIDASKNMIEYAEQYCNAQNLSFEHAFIENFKAKQIYDLATLFSCFHWIAKEQQQKALQSLSDSLKPGGELLGMIITHPNEVTLRLKTGLKIFPRIQQILSFFKEKNIFDIIPSSHPTDDEFLTMLKTTDLEVISFEKKTIETKFNNKDEIIAFEKALFSGVPFIEMMPTAIFEYFFNEYIKKIMEELEQTDVGEYKFPILKTRVLHARKRQTP